MVWIMLCLLCGAMLVLGPGTTGGNEGAAGAGRSAVDQKILAEVSRLFGQASGPRDLDQERVTAQAAGLLMNAIELGLLSAPDACYLGMNLAGRSAMSSMQAQQIVADAFQRFQVLRRDEYIALRSAAAQGGLVVLLVWVVGLSLAMASCGLLAARAAVLGARTSPPSNVLATQADPGPGGTGHNARV